MTTDYDIITVGGGVGGSGIAKAMAERGYRVLVLERETSVQGPRSRRVDGPVGRR